MPVTAFLLDVNVLIALLSTKHTHHVLARAWFQADGNRDWLTSPTTENGVVRIMSNRGFSGAWVAPGNVVESLQSLIRLGKHRFVPDDITLTDSQAIIRPNLLASNQVTDSYLLAVAVKNDAVLATLDRRLSPVAVRNGDDHIHYLQ